MNRSNYFDYIEEKLSTLVTRIDVRGKLNILDLHLHSENFYQDFFNRLFDWQLRNLNAVKQNAEGIDLIDNTNKIVIQVSATATKDKVESSLTKDLSAYVGFNFKFISISKDAKHLRSIKFKNPHNLKFSPQHDIFDIQSILNKVRGLSIAEQRCIYEFIKAELGTEIEPQKIETNLATIINILARGDFNQDISDFQVNPFEVERKIEYNVLIAAKILVDDYKIHHSQVDNIYAEFDKSGANKSKSVLDSIRRFYSLHRSELSADDLFFKVFENVVERIQNSANYERIPYDELELCVNILMVDAFIRCKIFENPNGYNHVAS